MGQLAYLAVPGWALAGVFAMTSWPIYYIRSADVPAAIHWVASVVMLALCAGMVWLVGVSFAAGGPRRKAVWQPVSRR